MWPLWLFLFISHLSSLGSFHVSSFGIFYLCPLLGYFPHFKGNTLYIQRWTRSTHFDKVLIIKLELYHDVCNVCLCQCRWICNDTSASCSNYVGQSPTIMRLYDQAKACMTMKDQVMRWWMLHGNISRNGYGNAMIGRYGGCFEEDILRIMMTERIMPRIWMHRRSLHQLSRSKRLAKYRLVEVPRIEYSH